MALTHRRWVASGGRSGVKWKDISRGADSGSARKRPFYLDLSNAMCAPSGGKQLVLGQSSKKQDSHTGENSDVEDIR